MFVYTRGKDELEFFPFLGNNNGEYSFLYNKVKKIGANLVYKLVCPSFTHSQSYLFCSKTQHKALPKKWNIFMCLFVNSFAL